MYNSHPLEVLNFLSIILDTWEIERIRPLGEIHTHSRFPAFRPNFLHISGRFS